MTYLIESLEEIEGHDAEVSHGETAALLRLVKSREARKIAEKEANVEVGVEWLQFWRFRGIFLLRIHAPRV